MRKKLFTAIIILILFVGITSFYFIKFSNDHKECEDVTVKTKDMNGNSVVTTTHICKEKYCL